MCCRAAYFLAKVLSRTNVGDGRPRLLRLFVSMCPTLSARDRSRTAVKGGGMTVEGSES